MKSFLRARILVAAALAQQFYSAAAVRDSGYKELSDALSTLPEEMEEMGCTPSESTEWFNKLLGGLWPYVDDMVQGILTDSVGPAIQDALPHEGLFNVQKMLDLRIDKYLGTRPPRLSNFVMCTANDGLKLTADMAFKSDIDIAVRTSLVSFGLHDLSITGKVVIHFGQFISEAPLVGGVTVHFVDPPQIDWDLTGAGEWPWLDGLVRGAVDSAIAGLVVMPNLIAVPLGREDQGVDLSALKSPPPLGLLQVAPVQASNLKMSDFSLGLGLLQKPPDPYVLLKVGDQNWKSSRKNSNANPTWEGEGALFTVWGRDQSLVADVFNHDQLTGHDFLGLSTVAVKEALAQPGAALPLSSRKGQDTGASLELAYQWLCIVPGKLSQTLPSVLRLDIEKLVFPSGKGHSVQVVMTAAKEASPHGERKAATAFYHDIHRSLKVTPVGAKLMELMKMDKISKEDVMYATGLDETAVDEAMSTINANEGRASRGEIDIHSTLYMPFFPDAVDRGPSSGASGGEGGVTLEVRTKKASMGSIRVSLSAVPEVQVGAIEFGWVPQYTKTVLKINEGSVSELALHVSMNMLATEAGGCARP